MKTRYPSLIRSDFDLTRTESTAQRGPRSNRTKRVTYQPQGRTYDSLDVMQAAPRFLTRAATMRQAA